MGLGFSVYNELKRAYGGVRVQGYFFSGLRFKVFIKLGFRISLVVQGLVYLVVG
jgi:hypothetical protein